MILCTTLEELGHKQPPTSIQTDNTTAAGLANKRLRQRKSRSIDMRFHWIRDRAKQGQFIIYWGPGKDNKGDYHSKHHPAVHHRLVRYDYLHPSPDASKYAFGLSPKDLRGCVNLALYLGTRLSQDRIKSQTDPGKRIHRGKIPCTGYSPPRTDAVRT